jgi:hypothetical protein
MKASIHLSSWQIGLQTDGEQWPQNGLVRGTLTALNQGPTAALIPQVQIVLKNQKKLADKNSATVVADFTGESKSIAANATATWKFALKLNDQITDKYFAPYLIFGMPQQLTGSLALTVTLADTWANYLKVWQDRLRFKAKEVRSKGAQVEIKLVPPSSRDYAHLKKISAIWSQDEQKNLHATYKIVMQELGVHDGTAALAEVKKEITQTLTPRQYEFSPGMINTEAFATAAEEMAQQMKMRKF